jgi:hypothetical protein
VLVWPLPRAWSRNITPAGCDDQLASPTSRASKYDEVSAGSPYEAVVLAYGELKKNRLLGGLPWACHRTGGSPGAGRAAYRHVVASSAVAGRAEHQPFHAGEKAAAEGRSLRHKRVVEPWGRCIASGATDAPLAKKLPRPVSRRRFGTLSVPSWHVSRLVIRSPASCNLSVQSH